jgi:predicted cupin superfamily sugar epimerase
MRVTDADRIIDYLGLQPHPEGGWYRQTWVAEAADGARPAGTCIHFLLKAGERSHWHRVDAGEIWLWHAGAPIELGIAADAEGPAVAHRLGPDLFGGEAPQIVVPAHHWQAAQSLGDWTLVSCAVSPGFRFEGFELARPGFDIPGRQPLRQSS